MPTAAADDAGSMASNSNSAVTARSVIEVAETGPRRDDATIVSG
jgi:hypothetical protein